MTITAQIAKHLREVNFGGNWTVSNLKDIVSDITWKEATTKINNFNTIATLVFHINYFVEAQIEVLKGKPLNAKDELSFDHPPIHLQNDWEAMVNKTLSEAEDLAVLIEQLPENSLNEDFVDKKYGNYYRNLHGLIEHTHYHLGQIAFIKKLVKQTENS